ncbi:protein phosphatase 2C domain-containing protein [Leptothoe spongobia]|uniref:Protein phosphatase 2C domain-containing protein n=1 Tax=Leptothoe spongobia TAU-MAC 1115 TaxID=1967444 RepID=A0A947DEH0_9CYAN|nr:protein phosphatase 2C domain-containing protein [Leptothoe spongobia]MBT9315093.1 protein phosphatase 2C domain-containing protein [Leptothoe spongobia TAU-MAC 1115]
MIKCPNIECQAINPEGNEKCTSCQTFLPHRYLWVVGQGQLDPQQLSQRYVWQHQRVVLDTEPGVPPLSPDPVPQHIWPYLMLAPHGLHVPQPYDFLSDSGKNGGNDGLLLLDSAAIVGPPGHHRPQLLPSLIDSWQTASPLRQLNWLWQITDLWPDFLEQEVASSLLLSTHLRVHDSLVRLVELSTDSQTLTLGNLGAFWKKNLLLETQPAIRDFLENLCHRLIEGDITNPEILTGYLDQAIAATADGYQVDYGLSVKTDQGPSRKRNEDACYPASGTTQLHSLGPKAKAKHKQPLLLLVCDGIGGHDGGDVASRLAISTIQQELAPLLEWLADQPLHDPGTVTLAIEQAIGAANDNISHHNDQGQRQARDRMGTTIVMALIIGVYIYIGHVGDSRAYRISSNSCRQITFDDDVAAREVRLGYGFYADVAHRPGTGALIQALGMGNSAALHTVVQRLILDEDIVLLLCSDGLSDYDRVEQSWQTQLLPVLTGQTKPATAVTSLVQLANTYNGHDNITVGVVSAHIQSVKPPIVSAPSSVPPVVTKTTSTRPQIHNHQSPRPQVATQQLPVMPQSNPSNIKKNGNFWLILISLIGFLGGATALTMLFFGERPVATPPNPVPPLPETIQDKINQDIGRVGISDDELASPSLTPNSYLQLLEPVSLVTTPQASNDDEDNQLGQLPTGAIVQVLTRQDPAGEQSRWVKLKVCAISPISQPGDRDIPKEPGENALETSGPETSGPETSGSENRDVKLGPRLDTTVTSPGVTSLTSGEEGWVLEAKLTQIVSSAQQLNCPSQ